MDMPAWMQVVEPRLERAAEEVLYAARGQDARSRPAKAGIQWFRPDIPACKQVGMTFLTYPDGLHTLKDINNH